MLPVPGPGFRVRLRVVFGRKLSVPGQFGTGFGPFALGFRPKPAQNRFRKPGPGTGSISKQPEVNPGCRFPKPWFTFGCSIDLPARNSQIFWV